MPSETYLVSLERKRLSFPIGMFAGFLWIIGWFTGRADNKFVVSCNSILRNASNSCKQRRQNKQLGSQQ